MGNVRWVPAFTYYIRLHPIPVPHKTLHSPVVTYTIYVISEPMSISLFPDCTALKLTVPQSTYGGST